MRDDQKDPAPIQVAWVGFALIYGVGCAVFAGAIDDSSGALLLWATMMALGVPFIFLASLLPKPGVLDPGMHARCNLTPKHARLTAATLRNGAKTGGEGPQEYYITFPFNLTPDEALEMARRFEDDASKGYLSSLTIWRDGKPPEVPRLASDRPQAERRRPNQQGTANRPD